MWPGSGGGRRYRVALDLADLDLRDALAEAVEADPALVVAPPDAPPDVVVSDRPAAVGTAPVLKAGGPPLPPDAPVELILAAAHVLAAGLRLEAAAPAERPAPALSPREREVLALMADGAPNKVIARELGISVRTAKFHVAAVLAKLGARNRAEAVSLALREGLVVL
jgi:DNA-binding NarL/FixJ family response regulator